MKIAIFYDSLIFKGGSQRVVIELANRLGADIITSGFNKEIYKWMNIKVKIIDIGNLSYKYSVPFSYFFETPLRFLFYKNIDYDINIFFGIYSIFSAKKGRNNIWYCFTPNRFIYDLKNWKLSTSSQIKKFIYKLHILLFEKIDQKIIKNNIVKIIAQSNHIKKRIKKYYGMGSQVIYSPLDTAPYKFNYLGNYYLTVSRLTPEKRIDLIASVFAKLENKKLIIVGDGPEKNKIMKIIKKSKNIKLISNIHEKKLIDLYSKCLATIYIPIMEDFGLPPIESMASGKICIAANEGGCKETIINNKTGKLIKVTENNLLNTIALLKKNELLKMKNACIQRANAFDIKNIINQWENKLKNYN